MDKKKLEQIAKETNVIVTICKKRIIFLTEDEFNYLSKECLLKQSESFDFDTIIKGNYIFKKSPILLEKLDEIDNTLADFEDFLHGEDGAKCTMARKRLIRIKQLLCQN
jgi:hypothetical protein